MRRLLSAPEVADLLGIRLDTLYRYARSGKIPALKVGKAWRFTEGDLRQFLEEHRTTTSAATGADHPLLVTDLIGAGSEAMRAKAKVITTDHAVTHDELDTLSQNLGQALRDHGISYGDRVLVTLRNSTDFVVACFAVWKIGAILVPDHPGLRHEDLAHILDDARPSALIVDSRLCVQLETLTDKLRGVRLILIKDRTFELSGFDHLEVASFDASLEHAAGDHVTGPIRSAPDAVVSISYTSGSSGRPKGVMHTHESWLASAAFTADYVGMGADDMIVVPMPLHHGLAFRQMLACLGAGADLFLATDIYQALRRLGALRPSALILVPAAVNILLDRFSELLRDADAFLRYVEIGSAAISPERLEHLQGLLPTTQIHLPYGLTEARVGYLQRGEEGQFNQIRAISPGLKVTLVNDRRPVTVGNVGEIILRGRGLMQGYNHGSDADVRQLSTEGFPTGDMGRMTASGRIELLGRIDNMLKLGGRKVNPAEIEMVLNRHPDVVESAVVTIPDVRGILEHQLKAFVVLRAQNDIDENTLRAHCRRHMPEYQVPTEIHVRRSLPKSPVGKLLRTELTA